MLSFEDVLKIPPDAGEEYYRNKGLLPQPAAQPSPLMNAAPAAGAAAAPAPIAKMTPPVHPNMPAPSTAAAPTAPEIAPMVPPADAAPLGEAKPMTLPNLNFKERQALPMTSPGVLPGSSQFYENKLERIEDQKANPWGTEENHPGFWGKAAHVAAKVGNIAGDIVAPATMANVPGTDLNRKVEERQAEKREAGAKAAETTAAVEKTREKHEENVEQTNEVKLDQAQAKIDETAKKDMSTREVALRKQGLKLDEKGNAVPLQYEDMSPTEQAVHDLKVAQADSQTAKAALDKVKADPNNPQNRAILDRVKIMARNAGTAAGKLNLDVKKYLADYFGTDENGDPLPGVETDKDTGKAIGPKISKSKNAGDAFVGSIAPAVVQATATQDSVRRLMKILEPYKSDNQPFGSFMKQIEYKFGKAQADEIGQELAAINLASLQQAGTVMKQLGGTRSIQALKMAMQHTPDPTKDSTMLMYQKMSNIDRSLATFLTEADHYGRKKATAIEAERMTPVGGGEEKKTEGAEKTGPPEGKVSVYDPQGNEHFVLKEKKDAFLKDPKYKGWADKPPEKK